VNTNLSSLLNARIRKAITTGGDLTNLQIVLADHLILERQAKMNAWELAEASIRELPSCNTPQAAV